MFYIRSEPRNEKGVIWLTAFDHQAQRRERSFKEESFRT